MFAPAVSAIVPTLGQSPCLDACLRALRRAGERLSAGALELIVVDQTDTGLDSGLDSGLGRDVDRVLRPPNRPLGFADANNLALTEAAAEMIALVNDDAIVDEAWLENLLPCFDDARVGAAQGTNLVLDDAARIDGRGIAWNAWWQAIQIDRGREHGGDDPSTVEPTEVFGVSATAAIYRRAALESVSDDGFGEPFDARLVSYYEDVDLAIRLRGAGWRSCSMPRAIARHAGSATGGGLPFSAREWIHGNRILVLARMHGWQLLFRAPRILLRDGIDLWHARRRGDRDAAKGIVRGLSRALRLLPRFARLGTPLVDRSTLRTFTDSTL